MDSLEVCVLLCDSGLVEEKWEELGEFRDVVSMICNGNLTQAYEWIQSQHVFNLEDFKNTKNIEEAYEILESHALKLSPIETLLMGVIFLNIYIQENYTGPMIDLPNHPFHLVGDFQLEAIEALSEGEDTFEMLFKPHYLLCAKLFFSRNDITLESYTWWRARYATIHQRILSHASGRLSELAISCYEKLQHFGNESGKLAACYHLEMGLMYHANQSTGLSKQITISLQKAQEATGLKVSLTGMMGTRTKFQSVPLAQLTLDVTNTMNASPDNNRVRPEKVSLPEDTDILDGVKTGQVVKNLSHIDLCILLGLCLDTKNQNPEHGLTTEQMMPYVAYVLENPNHNWLIYSMALLLRSRLEKERTRTVERSCYQLQVLVDQIKDQSPTFTDRYKFFWLLAYPSNLELQRELGKSYMEIGMLESARELFERLKMYDDVITCLIVLEKESIARSLALQQIRESTSNVRKAKMFCILGDLKQSERNSITSEGREKYSDLVKDNALDYYMTAWEISGNRFARAMRSIGNYYAKKNRPEEAIEAFEKSLALSPLYPMTWFMMGCCALQCEKWDKAMNSFTRVVQQEPEDAESWNNLATIYLRLNKFEQAHSALQQALKFKFSDWKIWSNFLYTSLHLKDLQNAVQALTRIVEIRGEKSFDENVLFEFVKFAYDSAKRGSNIEGLKMQIEKCFDSITQKIANNPRVWEAYAFYYDSLASLCLEKFEKDNNIEALLEALALMELMIDKRTKQVRNLQISGWEREKGKFVNVAKAAILLADAHRKTVEYLDKLSELTNNPSKTSQKQHLSACSMMLRPIFKRTIDYFESLEEWKELKNACDQVETELKKYQ